MKSTDARAIVASLAAFAFLLGACAPGAVTLEPTEAPAAGPAVTLEPVSLKVGHLTLLSNAPFILAQEYGYFEEQGLSVELVDFGEKPTELLVSLVGGQVDVGGLSMGSGMINAAGKGTRIRAVADKAFINPQAECVSEAWVARTALLESGELDEPGGLKGRTAVITRGATTEYTANRLLESRGVTEADLELVEMPDFAPRIDAMRNGTLDISYSGEPWITRARSQGVADVWVPAAELYPNGASGVVIYGPSMYERDPSVGDRFMVAYLKAVRAFSEGKTERNLEVLTEFTQMDPDELRAVCWPSFRLDGHIDLPAAEGYVAWMASKGYIDAVVPLENLFDTQFVDRALALLGE